jgi:YVTN family beta-propeller protein
MMRSLLNIYRLVFLLLPVTLFLSSCEKESIRDDDPVNSGYSGGVFIYCEGAFNAGNGSISWYDPETDTIINNLFEKINGRPTGDVVQSFAIAGDYGVIVVNNSQKIEVIDIKSFESVNTISGFSYPRYFVYGGKGAGYLSNGSMEGHVYRIDINEGIVTDTIEVGYGPEQMVISGNYLFVANSGGWLYDNSVSVIDTRTDRVIKSIAVGDIPVSLVADRHHNIWVLCRGNVVYSDTWEIVSETDSRLMRINTSGMTVDRDLVIGQTGDYFNPSWLSVSPDGETLFFGEAEGLFSFGVNEQDVPDLPLIARNFTSAGIHPATGELLALEVTDYTGPGYLHIYNNEHRSTFETGIAPSGIIFKSGN